MRPQSDEIAFAGQTGSTLCAEFDDCEGTVGQGSTALPVTVPT